MNLKKILYVSFLLNVIFLISVVLLSYNMYIRKAANTEGKYVNSLISEPTAGTITASVPTVTSNPIEISSDLEEETDQNDTIPYYYSDLMENPIDKTYLPLITDLNTCQIEFGHLQARYLEIWGDEYHKLINILKEKAVYQEDKDYINQFSQDVENMFDDNYAFFEMVLFNDYATNPLDREISNWGTGTRNKLYEIRGKFYRNACMQIITLLDEGDYEFPQDVDFSKESIYDEP